MLKDLVSKLSSALSYFTGRYAPALITLILLGGFFFFYFNVIIAKNESEFKERKYRGLHRMARNITRKLEVYSNKNVYNFLHNKKPTEFEKNEYGLQRDSFGTNSNKGIIKSKFDTTQIFRHPKSPRKLYFGDSTGIAASAFIDKFIDPMLRRDLFDKYVLLLNDSVLFDELNISHQKFSEHSLPVNARDSVIKGPVKQSGHSLHIEIGGKEYKLLSIPFFVKGKYKFQLGGYVPVEEYQADRKSIPTYAILWLVIGIAMVILMIPLLKIFMMHSTEQLVARNAAAALASMHILAALIILAILNTYIYFTVIRHDVEGNLKTLAVNVDTILRSEVDAALAEIEGAQADLSRGMSLNDVVYNTDSNKFILSGARPPAAVSSYVLPKQLYPYFKHIVWTNKAGRQLFRWTKDSAISEKINVRDREYFKAVRNNELLATDNGKGFYLTSILSWVSDKNLALIAVPMDTSGKGKTIANDISVVSLSGRFRSLFESVFPSGYGFCVVKSDGEVLFHIDENRNLNENLLKECNDNQKLYSLLQNRGTGFLGCRYSGTHQRFYTMPIQGMPFSIVTFRDMKLTWSEDLDLLSTCSILVLINLAAVLLAIIIIKLGSYRSSEMNTGKFFLPWLRPNDNLKNEYISLCFYYMCSMILLQFFNLIYDKVDQLSLIGSALFYSFILISTTYHRLVVRGRKNPSASANTNTVLWALVIVYAIGGIIFSINLVHGRVSFILSQLCLLAVYFTLTYMPGGRNNFGWTQVATWPFKNSFGWWYISIAFIFILATAISPLFVFYKVCYNEERLMSLKYRQWEFASRLLHNTVKFYGSTDSMILSYDKPYYFTTIASSIHFVKDDIFGKQPEENMPNSQGSKFTSFYKSINPSFSLYSTSMELLNGQDGARAEFRWPDLDDGDRKIEFLYKIPGAQGKEGNIQGLKFTAGMNDLQLSIEKVLPKSNMSFVWFIISVLGILWFLCFILSELIKRIFFKGFKEGLSADITNTQVVPGEGNIFIYGPTNSGKARSIKDYIDATNGKMKDVDLSELRDKEVKIFLTEITENAETAGKKQSQKTTIVLQNIESYLADPAISEKKLDLIERLLEKKLQVIILSSRSFEALPIKQYFNGQSQPKDFTSRWSKVLNSFYTVYHKWERPVEDSHKEIADDAAQKLEDNIMNDLKAKQKAPYAMNDLKVKGKAQDIMNDWKVKGKVHYIMNDLKAKEKAQHILNDIRSFISARNQSLINKIREECFNNDFLESLYEPLLVQLPTAINTRYMPIVNNSKDAESVKKEISSQMDIQLENICLRVQLIAQNYYISVWESLTRDEQRTLYDIALDELVNPANRDIAARLADLGLVRRDENLACYYPMNNSFRNFIFNHVNKHQIGSFRSEVAEKGFWRSFELPLIIIIIAVGLFLFATQKNAFDNLIAYVGGAIAGIGGLMRLLAFMPSSKQVE